MAKVDLATLHKVKEEASQRIIKKEPSLQKSNAKCGRPPKEDKANQRLVLLLTKEELIRYQEFCLANGSTQSGYLRYLLKQHNAI